MKLPDGSMEESDECERCQGRRYGDCSDQCWYYSGCREVSGDEWMKVARRKTRGWLGGIYLPGGAGRDLCIWKGIITDDTKVNVSKDIGRMK